MSRTVSGARIIGKERQEIIQSVQRQIKEAVLQATQQVITAFLEAEVTAKLGREKGSPHLVSEQPREIDWPCGQCHCQDATQFTRDGHYRPTLETAWGHIEQLPVPMLECQCCHHEVMCRFSMLEKFQRFWVDLQQDALFSSGHFPQAPTVVQCDGIWVTVQEQEEEIKPDKRQRKRHARSGKKVVILVAMGFWPDGRREILDWQVAKSRRAWRVGSALEASGGAWSRSRARGEDDRA